MDDTNVMTDAAGIVERLQAIMVIHDKARAHMGATGVMPAYCDLWQAYVSQAAKEFPEAAATIAAQAAELQRLREGMTRAEAAFTLIAGSHWERFGVDQTDVEQVPDLSSDEAMNVARDFLAYDDFPATSQEQRHD